MVAGGNSKFVGGQNNSCRGVNIFEDFVGGVKITVVGGQNVLKVVEIC